MSLWPFFRPSEQAPGPEGCDDLLPPRWEDPAQRAVEVGRSRLIVTGGLFFLAFAVIAGRMVEVTVFAQRGDMRHARHVKAQEVEVERSDIVDRAGVLMATSLPTVSLYANPHVVPDAKTAAERLVAVLPELNRAEVQAKLASDRSFVYLRRNLTPKQQYEVNALGVPGLSFQKGERRVYPQGALAAHVVGMTDVDNKGVSGVEKTFENELRTNREPLRLSLDVRVQTVLRNELARAMADFRAVGATGMVLDVHTGEMLAMVSLPDFDPNTPATLTPETQFNRATLGVYEMGSTFKLFNTALALDSGKATLASTYDASQPIRVGKFEITDYHPLNRRLTVPEILIYSSNIGSARMAVDVGGEAQKEFLGKLGMLKPLSLELPEVGAPLAPTPWRDINTMTIAYGHGIAVTPVQMVAGVGALVNGGLYVPPSLLKRDTGDAARSHTVIKPEISAQIRQLMRLVVTIGTGSKAEVAGYEVGGKTGTAEKTGGGGYRHKALMSSFVAAFPASEPRYVVLAMIDEPQATRETFGFATAGWTAAPLVGRAIAQVGPILGVAPVAAKPDTARKEVAAAALIQKEGSIDDAE